MSFVTLLECTSCHKTRSGRELVNLCECGMPLLVKYDLDSIRKTFRREELRFRSASMWRYRELLPARNAEDIVSLGEGFTPLIRAKRLASRIGLKKLWIKDESVNPTGSFKARGLAVAVTMARTLGAKKLAIPSAGNAAGALAAYSAKAGLEAHIFMPQDVPAANRIECEALGAKVTLVDGLITDCGKIVAERQSVEGWFDVSTLKEPYRIEGKKTLGLELAEQLNWRLPKVIFYPTGGGTGLIGMWKAFDEMEQMGWIDSRRPRMVTVQAAGCAPIVRAFEQNEASAQEWLGASTLAAGLRVPKAIGDFMVLNILRESGGCAVAVTDEEMMEDIRVVGRSEGLFMSPEGSATFSALKKLLASGLVAPDEEVVLFNTASGLKYLHCFQGNRPG
ncbi:MAG: threonine synthase [Acidobacteria bacterium]|nr:MAG: threonine synthase [Acidobacteriota bacterium]